MRANRLSSTRCPTRKAKVGAYAFTTLVPKLGVVRHKGREFVIADIPGLIEGAADGAGIGDRFLGHIERCRVLIHLVDISGEDPAEAMTTVQEELAAYGGGLENKPQLIALNKTRSGRYGIGARGSPKNCGTQAHSRSLRFPARRVQGIDDLMDAVLGFLPDRTSTETNAAEEENLADAKPWSPI